MRQRISIYLAFHSVIHQPYGIQLHYLGLTLRLNGREIIPRNGEVNINDLPVGGSGRYDTLECLSEVPYRGRIGVAYWKYTDPDTLADHKVDDINCEGDECKSPHIGWQSTLGIYRNGSSYYGVVRLGRRFENATEGLFTCHYEGDRYTPVSVNIIYISSEFYCHSRLIFCDTCIN